jgi:benzoate membrane transport protein
VPLTLGGGGHAGGGQRRSSTRGLALQWAVPVFTAPAFTLSALVSLALPLFIVTMASQNLPGVAAIRAAGYDMPVSRIITLTGVATLVLAPFGGSRSTSAPSPPPSAWAPRRTRPRQALHRGRGLRPALHRDRAGRRAVTGLLLAFPRELVLAIAGLALLGSIGGGLHAALKDDTHREAALITFLVTLSGVVIAGIGSAFWGVVAGAIALFVQQYGRSRKNAP